MSREVFIFAGIGACAVFVVGAVVPFPSAEVQNALAFQHRGLIWPITIAGAALGGLWGYYVSGRRKE
jgi:hypothetical protein